ncbi:MAG: DUF4097 domain-containing protein [Terriglobia bacterium]
MKRVSQVALGWLLLGVLGTMPASAGRSWESWTKRYRFPAGGQVAVENVQGSILVEGWDRAEVELTVLKTAAGCGSSPADAHVAVEASADTLRVHTVYRAQAREPVAVNYRLRVPRQVRLATLQTVNGDIGVRNLEGFIVVRTLNGHIQQTGIAGSVVAQTVNGNVQVALRALPDRTGTLDLETINGDVELRLPAGADADLELHTLSGRLQSDLFYVTRNAADDTTASARLGKGGVRIRLRTIHGDVRVTRNDDLL